MQVTKRDRSEATHKSWVRWIFLVIIWVLILSMVRDYWQTRKGFLRINETENRLFEAKLQNEQLAKKLILVGSEEFKAKLIREKLNMQRPDEVVVVMPNSENNDVILENKTENLNNWEKWLEVMGIDLQK